MHELEELRTTTQSATTALSTFDEATQLAIYRIVWKRLHGRKQLTRTIDDHDLVQEILLAILVRTNGDLSKFRHFGLVKTIAIRLVERQAHKAKRMPTLQELPQALPARRTPDPLLVQEFLDEASAHLDETCLELLTVCLENGYRLNVREDRKRVAHALSVSVNTLRHIIYRLRKRHAEFFDEYFSLL